MADPHGAIAYLGLKTELENRDAVGIFLETAHPVKFLDDVAGILGRTPEIPTQIAQLMHRTKQSIKISGYDGLKDFLTR